MHGYRLSFDKLDLDYLHNYKTAEKKDHFEKLGAWPAHLFLKQNYSIHFLKFIKCTFFFLCKIPI